MVWSVEAPATVNIHPIPIHQTCRTTILSLLFPWKGFATSHSIIWNISSHVGCGVERFQAGEGWTGPCASYMERSAQAVCSVSVIVL